MMIYSVIEEVWSISANDAERKLLRSSPPRSAGNMAAAERLAAELASKFDHHGKERDTQYPYWWGRNDRERESHRFVIKLASTDVGDNAANQIAAWRSARNAPVLSTGGAVEPPAVPIESFPQRVPTPNLSAWDEPQLDTLSPPPDVEALEDGEAADVIKEWFLFNFEDPTMETPRNDGEFTYIWGGPYDARKVIEDVYAGAASETVIEAAIRAVEDTGISDWAPHGRRVQPPETPQDDEPPAASSSDPQIQPGTPAPDFSNPDELRRWLQAQPHDVVAVFAARAALRVVPTITLASGPSGSRMTRRMTILRAFRGVALAWATAAYPGYRDALRAATNDSANVPILDAERAATFAAAATAISGTRVSEIALTAVTHALDAAGTKGSEAFELFKNALATDSDLLGRRFNPVTLAHSQLWPGHAPEWLQENWDRMKGDLLAADEGWDIWTDWYDDRLLGRAGNPTIEVARATIENQIWQEDPSTVNAHIKELIDGREIFEYPTTDELGSGSEVPGVDAIPQQVAAASQFALDAGGRVDLVPDPPLADGLQLEIYQEVRYKALGLAALGHNQLADLSEPINRFLAAAPERVEDVLVTRLWLRGNTLRIRLKAHETAVTSTDHTDPAVFPTLVAEMLRDLVESYNIFMAGDQKGRELDQIRIGPQERGAARAIVNAALPIVEAVQTSEGLATTAAVEALTEQVEAAQGAPAGINGDQAIDLSRKTSSNFVVQILRSAYARVRGESGFAWKEYRAGIYRGLGTMTVAGLAGWQIIAFVENNAEVLKVFVQQAFHNNPALVRIIELISKTAGGP